MRSCLSFAITKMVAHDGRNDRNISGNNITDGFTPIYNFHAVIRSNAAVVTRQDFKVDLFVCFVNTFAHITLFSQLSLDI